MKKQPNRVGRPATPKPELPQYDPFALTAKECYALRALVLGEAEPWQQKLAVQTIADKICRAGKSTFHQNSNEQSRLAGRREVGIEISEYIRIEVIMAIEKREKLFERLRPQTT